MASGSKTPAEKVPEPNSEKYYWVEFYENIPDLFNKAAGFTKETTEEAKKAKKITFADYVKVEKDVKEFLPYKIKAVPATPPEEKTKVEKENEENVAKFKSLFGADSAGGVDLPTFKLNWARAFGDEVDPAKIRAAKEAKDKEEKEKKDAEAAKKPKTDGSPAPAPAPAPKGEAGKAEAGKAEAGKAGSAGSSAPAKQPASS